MTPSGFWVRIKDFLSRADPSYAVLIAVGLILFWPVLAGVRVIFWGLPLLQFYPWHEIAKQTVLSGHWPLWNPWFGMGAPLLANAQSALLYPPNWLLLILPVDYGQGLLLVGHLLWAGIGMEKLSSTLGIGRLGRTVAGLAFMLGGYLAAREWFLTINASVAWLPWILLAGEAAVRQKRGWIAWPLTVALCLQWLAGHWQISWYTGWILLGWMAVRAISGPSAWRQVLRAGVRLAVAGVLAFALGAAQFLPTIEYWLNSQRAAGAEMAAALTYSFWPWQWITLIAPNFFGNPAHGDYWGYANFWEDAIYIGLLPLILAVAAVVSRIRRRGIPGFPYGYLLALASVAAVLGMGRWTPIYPFLFEHVPTFNLFQAPARILIALVFALCLLAAAGAEGWVRAQETSAKGPANLGVIAAAVTIGGIAAASLKYIRPTFPLAIIVAGTLGILIACVWWLKIESQNRPGLRRIWPAAAVALVAIDLIAADTGLLPAAAPDLYRATNPAGAEIAARLDGNRLYMPEEIRYRLMYNQAFLFRTFSGLADWMDIRRWELPNVAWMDGIASANNFDSFVPGRYAALTAGVEKLPDPQRTRLLGMMDAGAIWEWPADADSPSLRYLGGEATRAWGVCSADWMIGPEDAWQALINPQFDPKQTVILEVGRGEEGGICPSAPKIALVPSNDPNQVRATADFPQDGFLVLADVNYPGWSAFLDGERVPLLQADYAFRAVRVPAGKHSVEFRYEPISFWGGLILSAAVLMVLIAVGLFGRFRKSKVGVPEPGDLAQKMPG
jgi:hypothetical protein